MELTYIKCGDYLIPDLVLSDNKEYHIGKYGRLRRAYLKEHRPILYTDLIVTEKLFPHLEKIDTACRERLEIIQAAGVQRISINPQSFNDKVLEAIGRRHTAPQTLDAFALARDCGFDHINMDFIAGLPEDDLPSFQRSIQTALDLQAESITVHTLALKTSAYMVTREQTFDLKDRLTVSNMVDYAGQTLHGAGYYPYYMYRQSKSLGNLENVGWCKPGYDCLYNVYMMDETHTVLAVGAGAVTKLRGQNSGMIERIYNYKYPYEYIRDFDTLLERKKRIPGFYAEYD